MEDKHHGLIKKIFFGLALCILLTWLLYDIDRFIAIWNKLVSICGPVIIGACLAFVMNVPMRGIERALIKIKKKSLRRGLSMTLTALLLFLVIIGVFLLLIPQLVETIESLIPKVETLVNNGAVSLTDFINGDSPFMEAVRKYTDFDSLDVADLASKGVSLLGQIVTGLLSNVLNIVSSVVNGLFDAVIAMVLAVYFLFQKETLARQSRRMLYAYLPEAKADYIIRVGRLSNATFSSFLSGQCLEVVILGCMFAVCMAIFQMPYIPLVSVVVAVTAFIPVVGAWVGCILGAFLILVGSPDPMQAVWFVVMSIVLQQIENNLIYPRVVGNSIGLSGLWVMFAIILGGGLFGVMGMFIMIPVVSVIYTLVGEHTHNRLKQRGIDSVKLQDHPPELKTPLKQKKSKKK